MFLTNQQHRDFYKPCEWKCCMKQTHLYANRKYFWLCMNEMKHNDKSYESSNRMIYEQSIDLNTNDNSIRSAFCIGLDPENKFQVAARIRVYATGECLSLDAKEFRGLMDFLEFEKYSIFAGTELKNSTMTQAKRYKVQICSTNERNIYEIVAHNHSIRIDLLSLKRLCTVRDYIERLKHTLEQKSNKSENEFFKLMSHFYYGKTVNVAITECECEQKRELYLRQIINFHCDCLDKAFMLEIALNCEIWFGLCIPYFIKTLMLNEFLRWQTFSNTSNWPNETSKICTRIMSKSGFYYSGTMDNTICAFCGINLHDWKADDVPIAAHFKSQPTCPYVLNHTKTLNVDNDKKNKLEEVMSTIKSM